MEEINKKREEMLIIKKGIWKNNEEYKGKLKLWQKSLREMILKDLDVIMKKYDIYYLNFKHKDLPDISLGEYDKNIWDDKDRIYY